VWWRWVGGGGGWAAVGRSAQNYSAFPNLIFVLCLYYAPGATSPAAATSLQPATAQERATKLSHGATARLAAAAGDAALARLAGAVAADEGRHEAAYTRAMAAVFEADPDGAVLAFDSMMRKRVVMPAHLMDDGVHSRVCVEESGGGAGAGANDDNYDGLGDNDGNASARRAAAAGGGGGARRNLFDDFSAAAEDLGVYTAADYVAIMEHLLSRWRVAELRGLGEAAAQAQARLLALPARTARAAERRAARRARAPRARVPFSWLAGRAVELVA
jgi:acyl-[acyl-carrier-protein] desaturase